MEVRPQKLTPSVNLQIQAEGASSTEVVFHSRVSAFRLLLIDILNQMAMGNAITVIPVHAELTTQQAAEVLNVSRPFLIKLIEEGKLPCSAGWNSPPMLFSDLMSYKRTIDRDRLNVLAELTPEAQDLGMGYSTWQVHRRLRRMCSLSSPLLIYA